MGSKRRLSMVLLIVVSLGALVVAVLMFTGDDRPPPPVPIVLIVCAIASLVAAYGLSNRATWAIPLGIGSRAVDGLLAIPGVIAGSGAGQKLPAVADVVLSLVAILVLVSLRKEEGT